MFWWQVNPNTKTVKLAIVTPLKLASVVELLVNVSARLVEFVVTAVALSKSVALINGKNSSCVALAAGDMAANITTMNVRYTMKASDTADVNLSPSIFAMKHKGAVQNAPKRTHASR